MDLRSATGSADCREGTTHGARGEQHDVDIPRWAAGAPTPTRTAATSLPARRRRVGPRPIVELGPLVLSTDPRTNGVNAPRDATIQVTFTEPVDVVDPVVRHHLRRERPAQRRDVLPAADETTTSRRTTTSRPGEQCTVTIFKDQVHDQDLGRQPDRTPTRCRRTTSGRSRWPPARAPPFPPSVHLTMGNPSGAVASIGQPNNYLMEKPEFALSYNRDLGRPNWVSWHLSDEWIGTLTRVDTFRPDPAGARPTGIACSRSISPAAASIAAT